MYQIKCDDYILLDIREENLIVQNPKVKVAVNTIGSCSFTIHQNHPYYDRLRKLKSVFEVSDETGVIFRGRMTDDETDFYNSKSVDIEGAMGYFNDSIVRPYDFPGDFLEDTEYIEARENGNVIEFYLKWLIDRHNEQVSDFQRFKLGTVTVSDSNNFIARADSEYPSTWEVLKTRLFESELGGFLCIRYEADGNYIDYLSEFTLTNTQSIQFGENLLDFISEVDATSVYSAILPLGAEIATTVKENGEVIRSRLILRAIRDCEYDEDLVKEGDILYSKSAVEAYGWIFAPTASVTWDNVTDGNNLLEKAAEFLKTTGLKLANTIKVTAADLHFTDDEIQSFRIYRNVRVSSLPHGHDEIYQLTELDIDLLNPQNTKITVGNTELSLIDANSQLQSTTVRRIQSVEAETVKNKKEISEVKNQAVTKTICDEMISAALKSYVKTSSYNEFKQTVETEFEKLSAEISVHSDTGWIDLELQSGISVGSENAYLKGRLKDNVLYIKGDVVGISANQECFAQVPESLIPDNMTSTCFNAVYDMLHFCGMRLISDGHLYVTSNATGSWDTTKNTTVNVAICV